MVKPLLTVLGFMVVTFAVQGLSHFAINASHFASIGFVRTDPIMALGFAAMIVQALVISAAMLRFWPQGATLPQAMAVSLGFGVFLGSYIALAEPAKYAAPSVLTWMSVEASASFLQFSVFGGVLWLIYRRTGAIGRPAH